jgi:hypothetical protein
LTAESDTNGNYRFLQVPTGTYVLEVSNQSSRPSSGTELRENNRPEPSLPPPRLTRRGLFYGR